MQQAIFTTSCPSCGAPVEAHSASSVTLVCGYCHSTLLREDGSVRNLGLDAALVDDASPLQLGSGGRYQMRRFTLIGRLQVRYEAGAWNEWYILFDDGSTGWLSEAGDLYVLTRRAGQQPGPGDMPAFDEIEVSFTRVHYHQRPYLAADKRQAVLHRAGAEGELPFRLQADMPVQVVDCRSEQYFLTLDYGSGEAVPEVFAGETVALEALAPDNLRSDGRIRLKGTIRSSACPQCGGTVQWAQDVSSHVVCPSCSSQIELAGDDLRVAEAHNQRQQQQQRLTLQVGQVGNINGQSWQVMGIVVRQEWTADAAWRAFTPQGNPGMQGWEKGWWTEYLLYNRQQGWRWLVESEDGWQQSATLTQWPLLDGDNKPLSNGRRLPELYSYGGSVLFAAGAFYWQVREGDMNHYTDYQWGRGKLCAERSADELAWSRSQPVPYHQVAAWFGLTRHAAQTSATGKPVLPWILIVLFTLINLPAWLVILADGDFNGLTFLLSAAVYWLLWRPLAGGGDDDDEA
ncbi:endogenous inhibitor of DNA gyrase (YacG/DUF329 family) [Neisseria sp. HSC-16F19]|nr:endogenous inhibitor of DNA gyrase (YacG/DUF329 family) [Neisseria sp. HSC-16F19]